MATGRITNWLDQKLYPGVERNWDDQLLRERILVHLQADSVVLDLGAGAGIVTQMNFHGMAKRICGIDLDPRVVDNPFLDEGIVTDGTKIPYNNASFDIVFSDNVLEHLENPEFIFQEVARVLKIGGIFLFKTPNKYHYMPLIARMTPTSFHGFFNRLRGREEIDTFPTKYRANCQSDIIRLSALSGFDVRALEHIERRPEYLRFTWITYLFGALYERIVNNISNFDKFRILLIGALIKK
jgi:SAM-dependent methyltransferase